MTTDYNTDYTVPARQEFYWILATHAKSGRPIILGAYNTEEEANRIGFEKIEGSFEVVALGTRDINKANKILKYRRFDQTSKLEEAMRRAKHQI